MNEEQKRIKAIIDEQIQLLKNNPKLKGKTDAQLWTAELKSRVMKANMANPEWKAVWSENFKAGTQKRSNNTEWRENVKASREKLKNNPEFQNSVVIRSNNHSWRENQLVGAAKRAENPTYRDKNQLHLEKLHTDLDIQEKRRKAHQQACNKQISCDGVIYESGKAAAIAIAPETFKTTESKAQWLKRQMKKFPERYFYITESE